MATGGKIRVAGVRGWRGAGEFLGVARALYGDDPNFIRPPDLYERRRLDPGADPFWKHAEGEMLVARRGSRPVGRVLAFRNRLHEEAHGDGVGFFGLFESPDDRDVARALLDEAAAWARARGLPRLRGPLAFTMLEEVGLLVEGFDRPPRVRTPYNPPYYAGLLEAAGFAAVREFGAYDWRAWDLPAPPRHAPGARIELAPLDPERVDRAVDDFVEVHNHALRATWGFAPIAREDAAHLLDLVVTFGDPRLVWQARVDDVPAGFLVGLPDLNESLARSGGGLLALATALYLKRGVRAARVLAFGVRERFRGTNLAAHLINAAWQSALDAGIVEAEFSPVDLGDRALVRMLDRIGCRRTKRYALFERGEERG